MVYGIGYQMEGDKIPEKDNIARFCAPKTAPDGEIQAPAFMLRAGEENLSVNWLEYLNCSNRDSEIVEIQKVYSAKLKVGAKAKIVVLNVGEVCEKVKTESPDKRNLDVLHNPEDEVDPSHSGIYNMRPDHELIAELIRQTIRETYPART